MITFAEVKGLLVIDKHDLDRELSVQADVMFRISEAKVAAASAMNL